MRVNEIALILICDAKGFVDVQYTNLQMYMYIIRRLNKL
jgi:hypothetical protein